MKKKIIRIVGIQMMILTFLGLPAVAFAANSGGEIQGEDSYIGLLPGSNNTINFDTNPYEGKTIRDIRGGDTENGDANNNTVTVGSVPIVDVYGGSSRGRGDANGNTVTINGASPIDYFCIITGGYSTLGHAKDNTVTINGVTFQTDRDSSIGGGYAENSGDATGNTVTLNESTIKGDITGAYARKGNSTGNIVILNGSNINGSIYGGSISEGTATGNTVTLNGSTVGGYVYGGYAYIGSSDIATGNTLQVKSDNPSNDRTVYGIKNFEYLEFTLPEEISNGFSCLDLTCADPISLSNMKVSVTGPLPKHKAGDKIILIDCINNGTIVGFDKAIETEQYKIDVEDSKRLVLTWLKSSSYTVKFINDDGTVLQSSSVPDGGMPSYTGATPTKQADAQYTYTFAGWNPEITTVTGDATYKAKYKSTPKPKPATKVSGTPIAKATAKGKTSLAISWNKIQGVAGYDIFFAICAHKGEKTACKKIKTIKGNKTFTWTKTGLKKNTGYKTIVKAYVMKNGKKSYVRTSPMMHAYTGGQTKSYTNAKSVTVNKTKVSLKKGKSFKIKAKVNKVNKNKKLMPKGHAPTLRYMTSNKKIATVSGGGKITAKGKGTCYVYVLAHNGVYKQIKVTVK